MIQRVYAKNYRSIAEIDVSLDRLTVLIGPNGSGKSNFVDILKFVSDGLKKGLESAIDDRHGIKAIRRWAPRRPYDIEIEIDVHSQLLSHQEKPKIIRYDGKYRMEIKSTKPEEPDGYASFKIKRELCKVISNNRPDGFEILNGKWIKQPKYFKFEPTTTSLILPFTYLSPYNDINYYLRRMTFYNIYPYNIKVPMEPSSEYPLESNGKNIASVLRRMQREKSEWLTDIKKALSKVVPGITDVKVKPIGGFLALKFKHEYEDAKPHDFEASQESDGTLRVLGILVALFQEPPPSLIVIEEPEITVHPGVLGTLADLISEASQKRSQVIITTHSPDLISKFDPKNLRVVEWNYQDGTTIAPVDETQLEIINDKLFTSGDLLRIEGLRTKR